MYYHVYIHEMCLITLLQLRPVCMCVYVCMYVSSYIRMYVLSYIRMYYHLYIHEMCLITLLQLRPVCMCIYVCMNVLYIYIYTYIHTCMHTYIHAYIHACIHEMCLYCSCGLLACVCSINSSVYVYVQSTQTQILLDIICVRIKHYVRMYMCDIGIYLHIHTQKRS